tara:strand:- start:173 stop:487 length:315 start_codon:yes stop_codon:yes gene_type:complete
MLLAVVGHCTLPAVLFLSSSQNINDTGFMLDACQLCGDIGVGFVSGQGTSPPCRVGLEAIVVAVVAAEVALVLLVTAAAAVVIAAAAVARTVGVASVAHLLSIP